MQKPSLGKILDICLQHNLPFFSYRMPNEQTISTGIQLSSEIKEIDSLESINGFIIQPFDSKSRVKPAIIMADISFSNDEISDVDFSKINSTRFTKTFCVSRATEITKPEYILQANQLIKKLTNKELDKVVLSRTINRSEFTTANAVSIFLNLTQHYPNAFVSIFHQPGEAIWIGATPETLVKSYKNRLQTMSLAGTKSLNPDANWSEKERIEQDIVSQYVESILRKYPFDSILIDGPKDHIAGNICHLMTKYDCQGTLSHEKLFELISELHPTPAVCGIPTKAALECIREIENHDREYYAGYLGPISENECDLFVNLRCMKLTDENATLFVGGGITAQSVAESEWQETCLKSETLLSVIKK